MGALQGWTLSGSALLRVEGLTKRYGAVAALDGVDLAVRSGEMFVLLGGSGSGKSTLLRCIAGFVRPEAGRIRLDGRDLLALPPHRRPVNIMFQSYALFPHRTVAGNVGFGLRRAGLGRREVAARVDEMLELVRLAALRDRWPSQLSGGQRQRVALARALACRPRLLLLDEPLSALDRSLRERTRAELVGMQRRLGTTFVLVTHDQEEAMTMGTRIGIMQAGRLLQAGSPAEVYERPLTRAVAEFLGAANVLSATVLRTGPEGALLEVLGLGTVRTARPAPVGVGERLFLALRPERLALDAPDGINGFAACLVECAYRGDTLLCGFRLADGTLLRASFPLSRGSEALRLAPGAPVRLGFAPEACILLAS